LAQALTRLTKDDRLTGLVGNGAALRSQWDSLNLTRQAATIAALVEHIVIHPAKRASNRMDIGRVQPIWHL
jgi:site-specific DNA recombinase